MNGTFLSAQGLTVGSVRWVEKTKGLVQVKRLFLFMLCSVTVGFSQISYANDVEIVNVYMEQTDAGWRAEVTLKHDDTGWGHYADAWRIVDGNGHLYKTRVLYHPHVNEQPFTRSLSGIVIPEDQTIIYVEAHDKQHGWSKQRVKVDLTRSSGERYHVRRK